MKRTGTFVSILWLTCANVLPAQDTVNLLGGKKLSGAILSESPDEVKLKPRSGPTQTAKTNLIDWIKYDKQSPYIRTGILHERGGKYEDAIETYEKELAKATRKGSQTALRFFMARSKARLALGNPSRARAAVLALEDFLRQNPGTRFEYQANRWLGEVHLTNQDLDKAKAAFEKYSQAPFADYKLFARMGLGRIDLAQGKYDSALKTFDEVSKTTAKTDQEKALVEEAAMLKASSLAGQKKFAEAERFLLDLVKQAATTAEPNEPLLAKAYNELGDCQRLQGEAAGDRDKLKEALLSYLRVDVLYNKQRTEHARALYWITKTFQKLGDAPRANKTYNDLRSRYANSEWSLKAKEEAGG